MPTETLSHFEAVSKSLKGISIDSQLFKAIVSVAFGVDKGYTKPNCVRYASKKYNVTQCSIEETIKLYKIPLHLKAKEENDKYFGMNRSLDYMAISKARKESNENL
jgi:hypothetical protein